jgi:hypothetical protein
MMKTRRTDSYFVDPVGEKYTIRTLCGTRTQRDTYEIFIGGWRVKEYATKRSVRNYIVARDLRQVASHSMTKDAVVTSARAVRDPLLDCIMWANTPST